MDCGNKFRDRKEESVELIGKLTDVRNIGFVLGGLLALLGILQLLAEGKILWGISCLVIGGIGLIVGYMANKAKASEEECYKDIIGNDGK